MSDLKGKPIVAITNGAIIAKVSDLLVDPVERTVSAIIGAAGGLLSRQTLVIPVAAIHVWGQDVILVHDPDVVIKKEQLACHERCLSVEGQLKGREVVTEAGKRVAVLNDIVVDMDGRLVGYDLGKVLIEGPVAETKRIPVEATHALGPDLLVVDEAKLAP
jgi:sporulation protein YlmC with PRC-barrel domain